MAHFLGTTANTTAGGGTQYVEWDSTVDREQVLRRLEFLARFLDDAIVLPGIKYRIGWDGLIGLVPGIGDALTTLMSGYLIWEARRLGVSQATIMKMVANVLIDMLAGSVPVVGDLFDMGWKANRRNLNLLREALSREATRAAVVLTPASRS
jgi:hypothetical protein